MLGKDKASVSASAYDVYIVGEQIRRQMHRVNLVKDRRYHLRKYRKCFVGRDAIDWLVKLCHAQSRGEAIMAMRCLQEHGMLRHVVDDHVFKDQNLYFRFTRDDDRYLLQSDLTVFYRGLDIFERVKGSRIRREFYHRGHLYQDAFYGCDLVDCLVANDDKMDRADVIKQCRELLEYDIIRHVTDDYHFTDDRLMYQFHVDYDKACLLSDVLRLSPTDHSHTAPTPTTAPGSSSYPPASAVAIGSEDSCMDTGSPLAHSQSSQDSSYLSQTDSAIGSADDFGDEGGDVSLSLSAFRRSSADRGATMTRRVVELRQDEVGYGFVLRGSGPCYVHTIDPLGPAAAAGLKEGQYVLSVNGQNMSQQDHRHVGRVVMTHTGSLKMTVLTRTQLQS